MRRISIYILLFVYVGVQVKPLMAIVEDTLAHTFWKMKHMTTVHYENGHYHLHTELNDIAEKDSSVPSEKAPSSQKTNETISSHIAQEFNFQINPDNLFSIMPTPSNQDVVAAYLQITSPPPRA